MMFLALRGCLALFSALRCLRGVVWLCFQPKGLFGCCMACLRSWLAGFLVRSWPICGRFGSLNSDLFMAVLGLFYALSMARLWLVYGLKLWTVKPPTRHPKWMSGEGATLRD